MSAERQAPDQPLFHAPFLDPASQPDVIKPPADPVQPPNKSKLLPAVIILSLVELIVIVVLIVAVAANSKSKTATNANKNADNSQAQGPTAATSSSVQLTDDSI